MAAFAGGLCLTACGGGGGGNGGQAPPVGGVPTTPAPPPPAPPTPPPPAGPTYSTFDNLQGNQAFSTSCAPLQFSSQVPLAFLATEFGRDIPIDYQAASQTYSFLAEGRSLSFGPADRDASAPAGVVAYAKPGASGTDRFAIARPAVGNIGLDYVRAATVNTSRFGLRETYSCVLGVPTLVTDVPAATTVSFGRVGVAAAAYDRSSGRVIEYTLAKSEATFVVDLTTGRVNLTMRLIGTPVTGGGADVAFGTVTGAGTVDAATGGFDGQFASTDREANGFFGGAFFGPQGREFGFAYGFSGRTSNAQELFASSGTVAGTR